MCCVAVGDVFTYQGTVAELGYSQPPMVIQVSEPFLEFQSKAVRVEVVGVSVHARGAKGSVKFGVGVQFTSFVKRLKPWGEYVSELVARGRGSEVGGYERE